MIESLEKKVDEQGSIDRDLVNYDIDRKLTVTELNNRLHCVLCTDIESFNIFRVSSIQASFKVQQKIQILRFFVVCINLLERGLLYIKNLLP